MTPLVIALICAVAILAIDVAILWFSRPKVVKVCDEMPKDGRPGSKIMKLQNELSKYVYEKEGKICIFVVAKKKHTICK